MCSMVEAQVALGWEISKKEKKMDVMLLKRELRKAQDEEMSEFVIDAKEIA